MKKTFCHAWQHQVLAAVKGFKLQSHFKKDKVPENYATKVEEEIEDNCTAEYERWEQQDSLLLHGFLP